MSSTVLVYDGTGRDVQDAVEAACVALFEAGQRPMFAFVPPRLARFIAARLWSGTAAEIAVIVSPLQGPKDARIADESFATIARVEHLGE